MIEIKYFIFLNRQINREEYQENQLEIFETGVQLKNQKNENSLSLITITTIL